MTVHIIGSFSRFWLLFAAACRPWSDGEIPPERDEKERLVFYILEYGPAYRDVSLRLGFYTAFSDIDFGPFSSRLATPFHRSVLRVHDCAKMRNQKFIDIFYVFRSSDYALFLLVHSYGVQP